MWPSSLGSRVTTRVTVHYGLRPADQDGVEIDRCPGCGAKVRPDASWCTLCYQDLRPASQLVTTPAPHGADATDAVDSLAAPLVDASLEPGSGHWDEADGDIVDAEIIGEDGRIYAPRSGSHDADFPAGPAAYAPAGTSPVPDSLAALDAELDADGEQSPLAALTWSCKCGEIVSFAEDGCPVCGGHFLGELHDSSGGRHRPGGAALSWLPESRQVRLALSAFVAIAIAVFIPLFMSLFG